MKRSGTSDAESVAGVVLAGGISRRFGTNKALSLFHDERLIERLIRSVRQVTDDLFLVTNTPSEYAFLGLRTVRDIIPGCGALGGIYTGLKSMTTSHALCIACDMPFVGPSFLSYMLTFIDKNDVVVPISDKGYEPLCAIYGEGCIDPIEKNLLAGRLKIINFYEQVHVKSINANETPLFDPRMLFNVNTWEDYKEALRIMDKTDRP